MTEEEGGVQCTTGELSLGGGEGGLGPEEGRGGEVSLTSMSERSLLTDTSKLLGRQDGGGVGFLAKPLVRHGPG